MMATHTQVKMRADVTELLAKWSGLGIPRGNAIEEILYQATFGAMTMGVNRSQIVAVIDDAMMKITNLGMAALERVTTEAATKQNLPRALRDDVDDGSDYDAHH